MTKLTREEQELINKLVNQASVCRRFVRQLDAPTLHGHFNKCADLMDEAAAALQTRQVS